MMLKTTKKPGEIRKPGPRDFYHGLLDGNSAQKLRIVAYDARNGILLWEFFPIWLLFRPYGRRLHLEASW